MTQERRFLDTLARVDGYRIDETGVLVLTGLHVISSNAVRESLVQATPFCPGRTGELPSASFKVKAAEIRVGAAGTWQGGVQRLTCP